MHRVESIYPIEPKGIKKEYMEESLATSIPLFAIGFKDAELETRGKEQIKKRI